LLESLTDASADGGAVARHRLASLLVRTLQTNPRMCQKLTQVKFLARSSGFDLQNAFKTQGPFRLNMLLSP
jgi:hypothetical protein